MPPGADLARALAELEAALSDFMAAYEAWLRSGEGDERLRALLDEAERRVDAARSALDRFQSRKDP